MFNLLTLFFGFLLSTQCRQEFTFLGITDWEHSVFWIIEDASGECDFSRLIQISIKDSSASVIETYFDKYKKTQRVSKSLSEFHLEQFEPLSSDKKTLFFAKQNWFIEPPHSNDSLFERFSFNANYVTHQWNAEKGFKGMVLPNFKKCSSKLLYAYQRGLYINYELDSGYYVPSKNLLIVFTKHPSFGPGGDTMHGFLIFKLIQK